MKQLYRTMLAIFLLSGTQVMKAQVPRLNSYPSAPGVVFLDFDGHTVTGTAWNAGGPIVCGPSGMDSSAIVQVFNRVAEDYRPFDLNITTDSTVFLAAPFNKRMRIILTVTYQWYGAAAGVAFVNSYNWGDDTPCFVFTSLISYNPKNVAEASSHEAGHTLGLYHQSVYDNNCNRIAEYNQGQGSGEIGWAPIMGAAYYRNMTLWNNGPNIFGCNSLQNELDILTTNNGFSYRADDHANSFAAATNAVFTGNRFAINGVVERNTDIDLFKFTQPANGRFVLNAVPYNVGTGNAGSDLDMQVILYNSAQVQMNMYNPATLLSSVIDTLLTAGVYYLRIEGKGNLYAPDYASLGSYALEGIFTAGGALPLHRLELRGSLNGDRHELSWIIEADEQLVKQLLEISTDGRSFHPLIESPVNDRRYDYRLITTISIAQYRLNVLFDNGKQYYSNIVTLRQKDPASRPVLVTNLVNSNSVAVNSPGVFSYQLYDLNGKTIAKGQVSRGTNTVNAGLLNGMYMISFSDGEQVWTDKFVKQ